MAGVPGVAAPYGTAANPRGGLYRWWGVPNFMKGLERNLSGLTVSQGRRAGEPFAVLPWQRRFVRHAFAPGVQSAALSVARGNGKTADWMPGLKVPRTKRDCHGRTANAWPASRPCETVRLDR